MQSDRRQLRVSMGLAQWVNSIFLGPDSFGPDLFRLVKKAQNGLTQKRAGVGPFDPFFLKQNNKFFLIF